MRGRGWLIAAALLLPLVWIPAVVTTLGEPPRPAPTPGPSVDPAPSPPAPEPLRPFAAVPGVVLHLPAERVRGVAFHEASMEGAMAMRPLGRCRPCRHPRFRAPAPEGPLRYMVMDPRGRGSAPTSSVDVVLGRRTEVLAPVTGRVRVARRYRLYGRYPDRRVAIVPDGAVGIEVVIIHLRGVRLAAGDRVTASVTPLGWARGFTFDSQVDRYVRGGHPHVHIEVVDAEARREAKRRERRSGEG